MRLLHIFPYASRNTAINTHEYSSLNVHKTYLRQKFTELIEVNTHANYFLSKGYILFQTKSFEVSMHLNN